MENDEQRKVIHTSHESQTKVAKKQQQQQASQQSLERNLQSKKKKLDGIIEFPTKITQGMEVDSQKCLLDLLEEQAQQRGLEQFSKIFKITYRPSLKNPKYVYFTCSLCKAGFNLYWRLNSGTYIVKKVCQFHVHRQLSNTQKKIQQKTKKDYQFQLSSEEELYQQRRQNSVYRKSPLFDQPRKIQKISKQQLKERNFTDDFLKNLPDRTLEIMRSTKPEQNFNSFCLIETILKHQDCDYLISDGKEQTENPLFFLFVTPSMKSSFKKYGDLLYFKVLPDQKIQFSEQPKAYMLGLYVVFDCNNRPLIAGAAILSENTTQTFFTLFEMFFSIHQKKPCSILTEDSTEMEQTIISMKVAQIFQGAHLLNPVSVISNIQKILLCDYPEQTNIALNYIKKLIHAKYDFDVINLLGKSNLKNQKLEKDIYIKLQNNAEKIFRYRMPKVFVNFEQNLTKYIDKIALDYIVNAKSTVELLSLIMLYEKSLKLQSKYTFQKMSTQVEQIFNDRRIYEVRRCFQKKVCERLLQNYVQGLRNYEIQSSSKQTGKLVVKHKLDTRSNAVENWQCNCGETVKSGIPCAHLLCCIQSEPEVSIKSLISKRWLRFDEEPAEKEQIVENCQGKQQVEKGEATQDAN